MLIYSFGGDRKRESDKDKENAMRLEWGDQTLRPMTKVANWQIGHCYVWKWNPLPPPSLSSSSSLPSSSYSYTSSKQKRNRRERENGREKKRRETQTSFSCNRSIGSAFIGRNEPERCHCSSNSYYVDPAGIIALSSGDSCGSVRILWCLKIHGILSRII